MYKISRAHSVRKQLTKAQRHSGLFAEEPVVLGKTLRRNAPPLLLTESQFKQHKSKLLRLEKAGSIIIEDLTPKPVEAQNVQIVEKQTEPVERAEELGEGASEDGLELQVQDSSEEGEGNSAPSEDSEVEEEV